jgi:hypothetical protein
MVNMETESDGMRGAVRGRCFLFRGSCGAGSPENPKGESRHGSRYKNEQNLDCANIVEPFGSTGHEEADKAQDENR